MKFAFDQHPYRLQRKRPQTTKNGEHLLFLLVLALTAITFGIGQDKPRPRARDLGITIGVLPPGPLNAITDVAGVKVGHTTLVRGDNIRTGVTAILPHGGNLFQEKVPGAVFVGNALAN